MPKYPCPICGDPSGYPLWIDREPPEGCPQVPTATRVEECWYQMGKARQRAEFRKLVPDAFDQNGNMLPHQLGRVLEAWGKANPSEALII